MSTAAQTATDIRPFHVDTPEEKLAELRRRIAATRLPSEELVADRSQGVQLATIQELARYWETDYDWRKAEAKLNALPQFTTEVDGVDRPFIDCKSSHENALPLIMTHGWPGSVMEMIDSVGPLTDPTAHGGSAEDAFHLVLPSLPGYGFSGEPVEVGWDLGRTARAWAELMHRLGYTRYVAQGGDVGAGVTDAMGRQAPEGLIGIHTNLLVPAPAPPRPGRTGRLTDRTRRPRAASLCRRRRSRSASRRSPARSGGLRAAGSRSRTPTSSTSTKSTGAATSPRGKSRSSSQPRCGRLSDHCVDQLVRAPRTKRCAPLAACLRSVLALSPTAACGPSTPQPL